MCKHYIIRLCGVIVALFTCGTNARGAGCDGQTNVRQYNARFKCDDGGYYLLCALTGAGVETEQQLAEVCRNVTGARLSGKCDTVSAGFEHVYGCKCTTGTVADCAAFVVTGTGVDIVGVRQDECKVGRDTKYTFLGCDAGYYYGYDQGGGKVKPNETSDSMFRFKDTCQPCPSGFENGGGGDITTCCHETGWYSDKRGTYYWANGCCSEKEI